MAVLPRGGVRRFVRRAIFYRGFSKGGGWLGLTALIWGWSRIRRFFGREPEGLGTVKIQQGASMAIVTGRPLTRRQAKRARKAERRAARAAAA